MLETNVPAPRPPMLWGWLEILAVILFTAASALVLLVAAAGLTRLAGGASPANSGMLAPTVYLTSMGIYLAVIVGVYLFAARKHGWAALGWRNVPTRTLLLVPLVLIFGLGMMGLVNFALIQIVGEFENPQVDAITGGQPFGSTGLIALLVLVAGLVPLSEELFFRGMLYGTLRERWGILPAVLISALLFALAHFLPVLMPALFVMGLILALLREYTGSVVPGILLHAMQNGIALIAIQAALVSVS